MCALLPIPTLTSATGLFHRHLEWNFACESAMMGSAEGVCVEDEHPIVEFKRYFNPGYKGKTVFVSRNIVGQRYKKTNKQLEEDGYLTDHRRETDFKKQQDKYLSL